VRTALDKLGAINKLIIGWVPGHNNIPGNELAENLARKEREEREPSNWARTILWCWSPQSTGITKVDRGRKMAVLLGTPTRT